ncbi:hypothetical protein Fmac_005891 [Flemingia macrophylla]|uniref:Pentatricopeptide repeat-containing protein n=1 Tax=Flemingia macrophylla TaxID=520843 RepID=A0ABD1N932_9FABA
MGNHQDAAARALYLCRLCTNLDALRKVHASLVVHGLTGELLLGTKLVSLYGSFGRLRQARALFDLLPARDLYSFKVMTRAYFLRDMHSHVLSLYFLTRLSLHPTPHDPLLFSVALKSCADSRHQRHVTVLHCHVTKSTPPDSFLLTSLVDAYAKCSLLPHARLAFHEIPHRDVVSWTSMIAAYVQNDCARDGLILFNKMQAAFVHGNQFTVGCLATACTKLRSLHQGKWVHGFSLKKGIAVNSFLTTSLLDMYVKCGSVHDARAVFDECADCDDVVSWTAMIVGYSQRRYPHLALDLFTHRGWAWLLPNSVTVSSLLSACGQLGNSVTGGSLHGLVVKSGLDDPPVRNALVDMYAKCGFVSDARYVFDTMPEKDVVSWNSIISGLAQSGEAYEALEVFKRMRLELFSLDAVTAVGLLSACASLGNLEFGCCVHALLLKHGLVLNSVYVGTALLNFYAKCGDAKSARMVFDSMGEKNAVTWSAMIGGYGMQGDGGGSLTLFRDMLKEELEPNEVVFTTMLAACSHSGMVGEGSRLFNLMCRELNFVPSMKHYACMVDLLARAGNVEEALDFIDRMPVEPSVSVFGAFLHGCGLHSRFDLGEMAIRRMLELHPDEACYYVLVSNLYASDGRWGMVKQVRQMIRQRGLNKVPGCSLVEMDINNDTFANVSVS